MARDMTDKERASLEATSAWMDEQFRKDGPCFICGHEFDHYGVEHSIATGDGRTRADVQREAD